MCNWSLTSIFIIQDIVLMWESKFCKSSNLLWAGGKEEVQPTLMILSEISYDHPAIRWCYGVTLLVVLGVMRLLFKGHWAQVETNGQFHLTLSLHSVTKGERPRTKKNSNSCLFHTKLAWIDYLVDKTCVKMSFIFLHLSESQLPKTLLL